MSDDIYRGEFRERVLSGRPRSILEVGAGNGTFLRTVKGDVGRLTALDPSAEHVAQLQLEGFEAVEGSAERLPFPDGEFDVVVFSYTPHHVTDWAEALHEALRVSRNGVEILDVWYDDTIADQRTSHAFDRWMKTIHRRDGMVHNDTMPPGAMLAPVLAWRDVTYDYVCRRFATAVNVDETMQHCRELLAKVQNDATLTREYEDLIAAGRRDGMTEEGAIMVTIEKRH
ncbi:MAG: class I SAM-dependent methyltransferase [Alphaproteobacteria bacterium]|nr:class I SAM-dependent methyltransferase [Alphaproteobacteria bacterium]